MANASLPKVAVVFNTLSARHPRILPFAQDLCARRKVITLYPQATHSPATAKEAGAKSWVCIMAPWPEEHTEKYMDMMQAQLNEAHHLGHRVIIIDAGGLHAFLGNRTNPTGIDATVRHIDNYKDAYLYQPGAGKRASLWPSKAPAIVPYSLEELRVTEMPFGKWQGYTFGQLEDCVTMEIEYQDQAWNKETREYDDVGKAYIKVLTPASKAMFIDAHGHRTYRGNEGYTPATRFPGGIVIKNEGLEYLDDLAGEPQYAATYFTFMPERIDGKWLPGSFIDGEWRVVGGHDGRKQPLYGDFRDKLNAFLRHPIIASQLARLVPTEIGGRGQKDPDTDDEGPAFAPTVNIDNGPWRNHGAPTWLGLKTKFWGRVQKSDKAGDNDPSPFVLGLEDTRYGGLQQTADKWIDHTTDTDSLLDGWKPPRHLRHSWENGQYQGIVSRTIEEEAAFRLRLKLNQDGTLAGDSMDEETFFDCIQPLWRNESHHIAWERALQIWGAINAIRPSPRLATPDTRRFKTAIRNTTSTVYIDNHGDTECLTIKRAEEDFPATPIDAGEMTPHEALDDLGRQVRPLVAYIGQDAAKTILDAGKAKRLELLGVTAQADAQDAFAGKVYADWRGQEKAWATPQAEAATMDPDAAQLLAYIFKRLEIHDRHAEEKASQLRNAPRRNKRFLAALEETETYPSLPDNYWSLPQRLCLYFRSPRSYKAFRDVHHRYVRLRGYRSCKGRDTRRLVPVA